MGLEAIVKGFVGEAETRFILSLFPKEEYQIVNNVLIPTEDGTTQADHVIVSPYGLFVVETKHKNGWIYGNEKDRQWTQAEFNVKYKFQNPLRQNYAHTMSLAEYLGIEHEKIHSVVVFWGSCEFKTPMPDNVLKGGVLDTKFARYIRGKTEVLLSPTDIDSILAKLQDAKENSGLLNQWKHVAELKSRHSTAGSLRVKPGSQSRGRGGQDTGMREGFGGPPKVNAPTRGVSEATTAPRHGAGMPAKRDRPARCPKCGGALVERISSRGEKKGVPFLGCSNYPKCRYIKEL